MSLYSIAPINWVWEPLEKSRFAQSPEEPAQLPLAPFVFFPLPTQPPHPHTLFVPLAKVPVSPSVQEKQTALVAQEHLHPRGKKRQRDRDEDVRVHKRGRRSNQEFTPAEDAEICNYINERGCNFYSARYIAIKLGLDKTHTTDAILERYKLLQNRYQRLQGLHGEVPPEDKRSILQWVRAYKAVNGEDSKIPWKTLQSEFNSKYTNIQLRTVYHNRLR